MAVLSLQRVDILWLSIITVLYGCHITLFIAASYILSSRWRLSSTQRMLFVLIIILFIMSTAAAVIAFTTVFVTADDQGHHGETKSVLHKTELVDLLGFVIDIITNISNVIADGLVIWRCHVVCGRRLALVTVLIALLVTGTDRFIWSGYVITYSNIGFWTASALINLLVTIFMGFEIWRVCAGRKRFHSVSKSNMSLVLNLMIESGIFYLISIIVFTTCPTGGTGFSLGEIGRIIPCIAAGISPTFLAVFLALGDSKHKLNTHSAIHADNLSDWQVARGPGHNSSFRGVEEGMTLSVYVTGMDRDGGCRLIQEVCRERCA
ncbi:hypothetical protein NEOLEDRAFT_931989 [Neolentinus lepideus HHB14362 ss-1]|uniref:Uncharacterized protein n=1 Tax=Neolentinus lepideus HHB14362 ss-1 TaxID=1314782 RepID=A0A165NJT0_9AGAM|nr:hypothetical protein NEOLEDRAFT_931989 [Neolentinus lepideus HHB14362 ss-1]